MTVQQSRHAGYIGAHLKSYGDEPEGPEVIGAKRETPVKYLKAIKEDSSKKVTRSTAQLKCLYTIAHSMDNKQVELEATMLLENYDLVAIIENDGMTGVWLLMATGCSEGTSEEGGAKALLSTSRSG
ncbi:hypothetical protein llap_5713 [Limosa lapponica baueri]|uniref:Uncharacterized protein n=1 Tax=Limosa lapponica baueri TaxID=1758121 RepID=A0A2I0UD73_LIMLA|nr:hypothetical protein llap_5713 [Limosa lapponica baueri]